MALERLSRANGVAAGIKVQDDAGDFTPVNTFVIRVQQAQVGDEMFMIIWRQGGVRRGGIGDVRIKWYLHLKAFNVDGTRCFGLLAD